MFVGVEMMGLVGLLIGEVLLVALLRTEQIDDLVGCEVWLGELRVSNKKLCYLFICARILFLQVTENKKA